MANPFDQFDSLESNPFDQFDKPEKPASSWRRVADVGISALKGAIGVPESVVGLADIATGGHAGRLAEETGFRPKEAKAILDEYLSPQQQAANKALADTKGFFPTIGTALRNPSTILHSAVESLPLMGAGGVAARGLVKAAGTSPWVAGAIGEGLASAGQNAEQVRQETPGGLLSPGQAASQVASGIGTGALALAGAGLARKLKIKDIDTWIAEGKLAAPVGASGKGFARRLAEGAISEGVFEELPQSLQEQMWQNYSLDKPIMQGVPEAGAMGMLTGAVMGGPAAALAGNAQQTPPKPELNPREKLLNDTAEAVIRKSSAEQAMEAEAKRTQQEMKNARKNAGTAASKTAAETIPAETDEAGQAPLIPGLNIPGEVGQAVGEGFSVPVISESNEPVTPLAPKTVAGEPVTAKTDKELRALAADPETPAITRHAAATALQARMAEQGVTPAPAAPQSEPAVAPAPLPSEDTPAPAVASAAIPQQASPASAAPEQPAPAMPAAQPNADQGSGQPVADSQQAPGNRAVAPGPGEAGVAPGQVAAVPPIVNPDEQGKVANPPSPPAQAAPVEQGNVELQPVAAGKRIQQNQYVGEFRSATGDSIGDLHKVGPNEWRVYKLKDFGNGEIVAESGPLARADFKRAGGQAVSGAQSVKFFEPAIIPSTPAQPDEAEGKPLWQMNRGEFQSAVTITRTGPDMRAHLPNGETNLIAGTTSRNKAIEDTRKFVVQRAIANGEQVPDAVLADYPDLKATPTPAKPEIRQQPIKIMGRDVQTIKLSHLRNFSRSTNRGVREKAVAEIARRAQADEDRAGIKSQEAMQKSHLFKAIKNLGGISPALRLDITGEKNLVGKPGMRGDIFKAGATSDMSIIARGLSELGYTIDVNDVDGGAQQVRDMIRAEMEAPGTYRSGFDEQAAFDQMANEREAREKAEAEAIEAALNRPDNWNTLTESEKDADLDELFGPGPGEANQGVAVEAAAGNEAQGAGEVGQASPLELTGQSNEEIAASEKAAREAKVKADADAKAAADKLKRDTERKAVKQASAAAAGDFNLTGTEAVSAKDQKAIDAKAATDQLAGQAGIFDQPTPKTAADHLEAAAKLMRAAEQPKAEAKAGEKAAPAEPAAQNGIEDFGEKIGGARKDTAQPLGARAKSDAEESAEPGWRKRFSISEIIASDAITNQEKIGQWVIHDKRKEDWRGQPKQVGNTFASKEAAEKAIPLIAVAQKHRVVPVRENAQALQAYEIWRDVTDKKRVKVVNQQFATRDDAMRYMAEHAVEIIETKTGFGEEILAVPDKVKRIGVERRTGPATKEMFSNTFGFRGVEFGLWNNQDERQDVMNHAYDGLLDLADVLNVPARALSLNGDLALAFGARGQGLSGAKAHYERDYGVINLTKMTGAGSLAHEWLHAADHYLARQDTKAAVEKIRNKAGDLVYPAGTQMKDYASHGFSYKSKVRPELQAAYKDLIQTMFTKAEQYVEDTERAEKFVGRARESLVNGLKELRDGPYGLARQLNKEYYKRNNVPASAEQLATFDQLSDKLIAGQDLATEYRYNNTSGKPASARGALAGRHSNDTLDGINAVMKAVRGRSGFNSEQKGTLDGIRYLMKNYRERIEMLASATTKESKTKRVPTSYAMENKRIDQGRTSDYWTTPHEMAARAFSAYVEDKIGEQGNQSDFLAYGSSNDMPQYRILNVRPFPEGAERVAINQAFDKFVGELKTKETDKGTALFSRSPSITIGIKPEDARAVIARYRLSMRGAPAVNVLENVEQAPAELLDQITKEGAQNDIAGAWHNGEIYLFANHLNSVEHAGWVLMHESTHHGLRGIFGNNLDPLMLDVYASNKSIRDQANVLRAKDKNLSTVRATEEVLANMGGDNIPLPVMQKLMAFVRKILRRIGIVDQWTDNDIKGLIHDALSTVKNPTKTGWMRGTTFSKSDQTDTPEFRKWWTWDWINNKPGDKPSVAAENGKPMPLYHGTDESRNVFDGGVFFTDSKGDASAYAEMKALQKAVDDNQEFQEIVSDILAEEGGESLTDLGPKQIRDIADANDIDIGDNGKGFVLEAYVSANNPLDLRDYGSDVGDIETLWDAMHKDGFVDEAWSDIDEDARYEIEDDYKDKALYKFLENEGIQAKAFEKGYDSIIFTDMSPDGGSTHTAWLVKSNTQFKSVENTGTFDPNNPDIRFSRSYPKGSAEGQVEQNAPEWVKAMPADMQETLRKAGAWRPKQTLQDRMAGWAENWQQKLKQGIVDQFDPIKSLDFHAYMLARMSKSAAGPLETALFDGTIYLDQDGAVNVNYEKGGFIARMQALKGEHDRFFSWVIGNRAARLMAEGRERNLDSGDIARLKSLNQGKMEDGTPRAMAYAKALSDLSRYNKSIVDMAEKAGLIDAASRPFWENEFYIPFYRMTEGDTTKGPVKTGGLVRQYAFKTLKGGSEAIGDPMENILRNWAHLIDASLKNQAAVASIDSAEKIGIARVTDSSEKGAVFVMKNGEKTYYAVDDPFILDAINSLGFSGFSGPAMKVMGAFKRWLTYGVTIGPSFRIRNVIRDSISMIGTNPASYNVLDNVLTGWKMTKEGSQSYASMIAGGGVIRFGTMETESAANIKRIVASGVDAGTILDSPAKVKSMLKDAYDWWMRMGDRSENMNRAALYQKLRDEGKSHLEASYAARDTMDFSMGGTWSAIRFLAQTVPFFNARLQGMYKLGRGAAEDPRRFSYVVGAAALASIALLLAYKDDDDWKQREDFDRETYWFFKIGDKAFRIPKPFEIGAIATMAERGLEAMITDDLTAKQFAGRMGAVVMQQLSMNPVPQLLMPMIETWANRSAFTGRPIESMGMQNLSKSERIAPHTSAFAQLAGKNGLVSPVQIDHLINGYFGWLGMHAVATADLAMRPIMGLPQKPAPRIDEIFVLGDFVRDMPAYQSKYVTHLYEHGKEVQEAMADLRNAQKIGATEKAAEILQDKGDKIRLYRLYTHAEKQLTQINQRIKLVQRREGDADVKREMLDQLYQQRNRIAKITEQRSQLSR